MLEIGRQMPGQRVAAADEAITVHGDDEGDHADSGFGFGIRS